MIVRVVLRRILLTLPMLLGIVTVTFFVTRVIPGDPAYVLAGDYATPGQIEKIRHLYGFDKPLIAQYWDYLKGIFTRFDLGTSVYSGNSVVHDLWIRLPSTLELVSSALLVAVVIGVPAGAYAAYRRGRAGDAVARLGSFLLLATPEFWFALVAIYVFFYRLGIAPAPVGQLGVSDPIPRDITGAALWDSLLTANWGAAKAALAHLALPVLTYGLVLSAPIMRHTRSAVLEVLDADYIRFGRSCGLSPSVLRRYAVRAALPPVVTLVGILFTVLIGGVVIVEVIFGWSGAAQYAVASIQNKDYSPIAGFVLVAGVISMIVFLIVDLLYLVIDPRVRLARPASSAPVDAPFGSTYVRAWAARARSAATGTRGLVLALPGAPGTALSHIRRSGRALGRLDPGRAAVSVRRWPASLHRVARSMNPLLACGLGLVLVLVLGAFIVPAVSAYQPHLPVPQDALQGPSWNHPFGTDVSGFDIFVRTFYASRIDLSLAVLGVGSGVIAGVFIGLFAGFSTGVLSETVMRILDVIQAFPVLILAITLVSLTGNNLANIVWVIGFVNLPIFARLVRSRVITMREHRYIEAAVSLGNTRTRLILRHVLPNALGPVIVQFGLSLGFAILTIAALAFLSIGVQVGSPEWGSMILGGRNDISTGQWWTVVFPGLALGIAVAGFNLCAEGLERGRESGVRRMTPATVAADAQTVVA